MKKIKEQINSMKDDHGHSEISGPLLIIAEILVKIEEDLSNIANKMYE